MSRQSNTAERKAQIVGGLAKVMAEQGYAGASVQAIAKAAQLSPGLIHYHFDRKLEILLALIESLTAAIDTRVAAFVDATTDPEEALMAHLDAYVRPGPDANPQAVACWVVVCAAALKEPEVADVVSAVFRREQQRIEARLAAAIEARGGSADDVTLTRAATGLLAAVQGAFTMVSAAPNAFAPGFAAPAVRAMATGILTEVCP